MSFSTADQNILNTMCPAAAAAKLGDKVNSTGVTPLFVRVDGNGFAITNGTKTPYAVITKTCTITGWKLMAYDAAGALVADSLTADVLVSSAYNTAASSICGTGTKPALSAVTNNASTTLTGWTTTLAKDAVLGVSISGSPATAFSLILILDVM